jgi:hypothetical protein
MKTYTAEELKEWIRRAFYSGYTEGINDGHPLAKYRGGPEAYKNSDIDFDLEQELTNNQI